MTRYSDDDNRPLWTPAAILSLILGVITIMTAFGTVIFYVAPLRTLPKDVYDLHQDMNTMARTQAVQSESLKALAEVVSDTKSLRREVDQNTTSIEVLKTRVTRLEKSP
jgi:hypothetical protein